MKLKPVKEKTVFFNNSDETLETLIQCCDSYVAVLTPDQVEEWFGTFDKIVSAVDAENFTDFGSTTLVFDIGGKLFTIVSDSGGENASGEFYQFCEDNNIECQFVIDSFDCTGISIDEIYTGEYNYSLELLTMLHKVFN
jgi:hypothetical protein